jgi:diguanylate cyclase (GGDEF)-like protein/PAS domain S-box-containing protein
VTADEAGPWRPRDAELAQALVDATTALVCIVDRDGRIVLANPSMQQFTGRPAAELLGQFFWDVYVVPEHVALAQEAIACAMETGRAYPQEGDWLAVGGERRRVAMRTDVLVDDAGRPQGVACVGFDVTAERMREAQLHRRTQTDQLTGIANRSALFQVLAQHLDPEVGQGCGVLFCDLDQFKAVNDRHGHAVGDQLLIDVAARLQDVAAPAELVARIGGDEFVLVCPAGGPARLAELAEAVLHRVSSPFPGPAEVLSIGVSVGVALGRPGESPDELVSRADRAMYGVKSEQVSRRLRHRLTPGD